MTEYIPAKDTAKLIRKQLKLRFPGIKFSVRSDHNSINIGWIDGPTGKQVEEVTNGFSGGGFDGMIDMDYSSASWLLPDGSACFAKTQGTGGSMGSVPAAEHDKPHPGARLVSFAAKYIFNRREFSAAFLRRAINRCGEKYGLDLSPVTITEWNDGSAHFSGAYNIHRDHDVERWIHDELSRRTTVA